MVSKKLPNLSDNKKPVDIVLIPIAIDKRRNDKKFSTRRDAL